MFHNQGAARTDAENRLLAGYLSFLGGFVNSAGFVLIGTFTSHVTGNVGRLANDLATREYGAAATALTMIGAFFAGAFVASMTIESGIFGRTSRTYAVALFSEATLLVLFMVTAQLTPESHPRLMDMEAALLCGAMGIQNSLVTRISGAVVRTTHLTGVLTDLGIESARWFRWWRGNVSDRVHVRLSLGKNPVERPSPIKIMLLGIIAGSFMTGAVSGAILGHQFQHVVMLLPILAISLSGAYALLGRRPARSVPLGTNLRR
jgi:uncharacterized membrane protein YoaK (UPF0700 family)